MNSYIPRSDSLFMVWLTGVKNAAFPNQAALGLTPAQFTALEDAANDFAAAYAASEASKQVTTGLVVTKDEQRVVSEEVARELCQMILANPSVSTALKGELGLTIAPTPYGPVTTPLDLVAKPRSNGSVLFTWDRNGAPYSTSFTLEAKYGTSSEWVLVATTSKSRVTLNGFTPGDQVTFRVFANRGGVTSSPSDEEVIYPGSDASPIVLSEAA